MKGLSRADQEAVEGHVAGCPTGPGLYRAMVAVNAELVRRRNKGLGRFAGASPDEPSSV
ncbi:MAG TPA: hypothetical protein VNF75_03950 [Candidatus Dormibacteraeota bacterium]|nr:hypothetical protein [Candidatus Dormibacteraeota bacterium]